MVSFANPMIANSDPSMAVIGQSPCTGITSISRDRAVSTDMSEWFEHGYTAAFKRPVYPPTST